MHPPASEPERFLPRLSAARRIPDHLRRLRLILRLLVGLLPLVMLGGCSLLLAKHAPNASSP